MNVRVILLVMMGLSFNKSVQASPTPNEFLPCKKKAVAMLEFCLKDNDLACWTKSKAGYDICYKAVVQNHDANDARKKAEKMYLEVPKNKQ